MTLWLITGVNIHGSSNVKYLGILGIIDHLWHGGRPTTGVYRILQSGGLVDLHPCRQRPPVPFLYRAHSSFLHQPLRMDIRPGLYGWLFRPTPVHPTLHVYHSVACEEVSLLNHPASHAELAICASSERNPPCLQGWRTIL